MTRLLSYSHLLVFSCELYAATAYPTGAGGCDGQGSVGGPHLSSTNITTGSLDDFGAVIYFGAVDKLVVGEEVQFTTNKEHTMVITSDKTFRGLLFRLTSDDASFDPRGALTVSPDLPRLEQISQVCFDQGIAGVTHLNNTDKTFTEAVLRTDQVLEGLTLEITLVVSNRIINGVFVSEYYYSSYRLSSYDPDATSAPTDFRFPTVSPTTSPAPTPKVTNAAPTVPPVFNSAATFPPTFPPTSTSSPTITASPMAESERTSSPAGGQESAAVGVAYGCGVSAMIAVLAGAFIMLAGPI